MIEELKILNNVFKKHKIPLWLDWGTLLGIYRDGKLIDDDFDLSTTSFESPYERAKLESIISDLQKENFKVTKRKLDIVTTKGDFRAGIAFHSIDSNASALCQKGLSVHYEDNFFARKFFYLFIHNNPTNLRYFFFKLLGGVMITTAVPISMICPLGKIKFKGMYLNIPNETEEYLEYLYGPNWKISDPVWPGHATKENIDCFKGTHSRFLVKCPKCKKSFLAYRPDFKKPVEKFKVDCLYCRHEWKERVAVRGTVLRKL